LITANEREQLHIISILVVRHSPCFLSTFITALRRHKLIHVVSLWHTCIHGRWCISVSTQPSNPPGSIN